MDGWIDGWMDRRRDRLKKNRYRQIDILYLLFTVPKMYNTVFKIYNNNLAKSDHQFIDNSNDSYYDCYIYRLTEGQIDTDRQINKKIDRYT